MSLLGNQSCKVAVLFVVITALNACAGIGHKAESGGPAPAPAQTTAGVVPGTQPTVQPSPPSGTTVVNAAAYACPTSDTSAAAVASSRVTSGEPARRRPLRHGRPGQSTGASQLVAVTYDTRVATLNRTTLATRESALGATRLREYSFPNANLVTHVLTLPAANVSRVEAQLRTVAGVRSVGLTGTRRYASSVNVPYYPNDPYFTGFSKTVASTSGGSLPAPTYKTGLDESADVPGQWDMHVTRLEYAFGYSQPNNGSNVTKASALGSSAVKIAIIDTGEDATHPELKTKIAYQRCFITNPSSNTQSTSTFTTDPDGHGSDVAGIAGAATSNGMGFTAAGGNVQLYGYRVFPTPDDNCAQSNSTDAQCTADSQDIATAIQDAVNSHVNVISLSLGGGACTNGSDPDPVEGAAIANALAANIIVVAASGNSTGPPVEAPACDPGVIAVGATALADGQANGSGTSGGSPMAPTEYVPSYSDYGSPPAAPGSASAWGIVAPGGDPVDGNDSDNLHWIENIWTSRPYAASATDVSFAGNCTGDYPSQTGSADCRILIAGTSMATPHVAGAAALIVSANAAYQSPTLMKQLLCTTADDISDPNQGCGRLNVYRAMASALADSAPPAAQPVP